MNYLIFTIVWHVAAILLVGLGMVMGIAIGRTRERRKMFEQRRDLGF